MDLWGFYGQEFRVPAVSEIKKALERVDYKKISVEGNKVSRAEDISIDLGGIAKGFASQRIIEIFKQNGIKSGIVSLGGNVQAIGKKPDGSKWRVGIQNPNGEGYIGLVEIEDCAVITSGGYQRYFVEDGTTYHHIIDTATGYPSQSNIISASIISSDAVLADGFSTSLFVMGTEKASEFYRNNDGFEAVLIDNENKLYITEGLKDTFSSEDNYEIISK